MGTFVVALILLAAVIGASAALLRDRRRGKCSCGANCGACAGCVSDAERHGNISARANKNR